jgi:hypothetical protein
MLTAFDAPAGALDEHERSFVEKIQEHGWTRTNVFGDEEGPGFSFTTGFWLNTNQPELIVFSMKGEIVHQIFWDLFRDAKSGQALPVGQRSDAVFANLPAYAFRVARKHYADYLGWSGWFYANRDDFPCLQIVWPDRAGRFPWEPDFDVEFKADQPDLTELGWVNEITD